MSASQKGIVKEGNKYVVQKVSDPQLWRPIIFSRNTALVTIPKKIKDKANLVDLYNEDLGVVFKYHEDSNEIIMRLGQPRPKRQKRKAEGKK